MDGKVLECAAHEGAVRFEARCSDVVVIDEVAASGCRVALRNAVATDQKLEIPVGGEAARVMTRQPNGLVSVRMYDVQRRLTLHKQPGQLWGGSFTSDLRVLRVSEGSAAHDSALDSYFGWKLLTMDGTAVVQPSDVLRHCKGKSSVELVLYCEELAVVCDPAEFYVTAVPRRTGAVAAPVAPDAEWHAEACYPRDMIEISPTVNRIPSTDSLRSSSVCSESSSVSYSGLTASPTLSAQDSPALSAASSPRRKNIRTQIAHSLRDLVLA